MTRIIPENTSINDEGLAERSQKDAKWDHHRGNTQSVESLYDLNGRYKRLAERMESCSRLLTFGQTVDRETGEMGIKLKGAHFCKVRHCPVCQWRVSLRNIARFYEHIPNVLKAHPTAKFLFLTLTVRNPPMHELGATLTAMNSAWKRLIERDCWPGVGFIRTTEVTKGGDGRPHPHFHALIMVQAGYFKSGNYLSQPAWQNLWKEALRIDYEPQVNVKRIYSELGRSAGKETVESLSAAVAETLKYAVKAADIVGDPAFLYGITEQLRKRRFLSTGGILKDALKEDASSAEMIRTGTEDGKSEINEEMPAVRFSWRRSEKKYRRAKAAAG